MAGAVHAENCLTESWPLHLKVLLHNSLCQTINWQPPRQWTHWLVSCRSWVLRPGAGKLQPAGCKFLSIGLLNHSRSRSFPCCPWLLSGYNCKAETAQPAKPKCPSHRKSHDIWFRLEAAGWQAQRQPWKGFLCFPCSRPGFRLICTWRTSPNKASRMLLVPSGRRGECQHQRTLKSLLR